MVTIDSQYQGKDDLIVQQLSHDMSHVSNYSSMDARTAPKEVWIADQMKYEG